MDKVAEYKRVLGLTSAHDHRCVKTLKRAYLARARVLHPDKPRGDARAFKRLNRAYRKLKDAARRHVADVPHHVLRQEARAAQAVEPTAASAVPRTLANADDPTRLDLRKFNALFDEYRTPAKGYTEDDFAECPTAPELVQAGMGPEAFAQAYATAVQQLPTEPAAVQAWAPLQTVVDLPVALEGARLGEDPDAPKDYSKVAKEPGELSYCDYKKAHTRQGRQACANAGGGALTKAAYETAVETRKAPLVLTETEQGHYHTYLDERRVQEEKRLDRMRQQALFAQRQAAALQHRLQ